MREFFLMFSSVFVYHFITLLLISYNFKKIIINDLNDWGIFKKGCYVKYKKNLETINNKKNYFELEVGKIFFLRNFIFNKTINKINNLNKNMEIINWKIASISRDHNLKEIMNEDVFNNTLNRHTDNYHNLTEYHLRYAIEKKIRVDVKNLNPVWYLGKEDYLQSGERINNEINEKLEEIITNINNKFKVKK